MAEKYFAATDATVKAQIKAEISAEIDNCTSQFESLLSGISSKLSSNGYSTDIIEEYRKAFNAEMAAGKALAGNMS
ncbi:hypothetical protein D3C71_2068030 [compost metagenome]